MNNNILSSIISQRDTVIENNNSNLNNELENSRHVLFMNGDLISIILKDNEYFHESYYISSSNTILAHDIALNIKQSFIDTNENYLFSKEFCEDMAMQFLECGNIQILVPEDCNINELINKLKYFRFKFDGIDRQNRLISNLHDMYIRTIRTDHISNVLTSNVLTSTSSSSNNSNIEVNMTLDEIIYHINCGDNDIEKLKRMHNIIKKFIPILLDIDAPEILQAMTITYNSLKKKIRT